jgi:uncharacterized membrane protein
MRIIISIAEDETMIKTLTFAILHFSVAFTITYLLTGSIIIGGTVALVEPAVNTVVFYFHDKAWKRYETRVAAH